LLLGQYAVFADALGPQHHNQQHFKAIVPWKTHPPGRVWAHHATVGWRPRPSSRHVQYYLVRISTFRGL